MTQPTPPTTTVPPTTTPPTTVPDEPECDPPPDEDLAAALDRLSLGVELLAPGSPVEDVVGVHITGVATQAEATGLMVWLEVSGPAWPDLDHVATQLSEWAGGVLVDVVVERRPPSWPVNASLSGRASAPCRP